MKRKFTCKTVLCCNNKSSPIPFSWSARSPESIRLSKTGAMFFRRPGKFHSQGSGSQDDRADEANPPDDVIKPSSSDVLPMLYSKMCSWIWISKTWTVFDIWTRLSELKWLENKVASVRITQQKYPTDLHRLL